MLKLFVSAIVLIGFTAATATAQTATSTTTSEGAFDKLSPGNQKIAQSLCNGQLGGCPSTSSPGQKTLTRDQIASMKQHRGWGEIFQDMKANAQIPPDVKNLGQLVSSKSSMSGTTITNGSGRSRVVGQSDVAGMAGKGHLDDGATGNRGANAGGGGDLTGHGRGYASGPGDSSVSGAGIGRSGVGGHGGGRGK